MFLDDFDYELPDEAIARYPSDAREGSKLLVLDRASGRVEHRTFRDLPEFLEPRDLLVLNDTRVLPARLFARKKETHGRVEILLIERVEETLSAEFWRCMLGSSKNVRERAVLELLHDPACELFVEKDEGEGFYILKFPKSASELAERFGEMPLPPYLGRAPEPIDRDRYQTVYAKEDQTFSVAAPTAGLHFSPALFERLAARGVKTAHLTLHVGPGTFLPVRTRTIEEHRMHKERYLISDEAIRQITETKKAKGRVVAVGTTVVRTLETLGEDLRPGAGATDLFIREGHSFCNVDAMITNFHLPKSTLLMLVSAFVGRDLLMRVYKEALAKGYRFFSYGDAMLIS